MSPLRTNLIRNTPAVSTPPARAQALQLPCRKSYPARSHKAVLRHAVAKHDPNAEQQAVPSGCVIGHTAGIE